MDTPNKKHSLFSVFGIEIEYMVVHNDTLDINPIVDKVFQAISNSTENEIDCGAIALNNELALHVIELKTNGPTSNLIKAHQDFYSQLLSVDKTLKQFHSRLMPTGMHPWLNPNQGIKLWPHGEKAIYEAYNRIFDCRGHGWSNLQSIHINLPFANDEEFVKLHNAIRIVLPLIPAFASSTPFCESKSTNMHCTRMFYYIKNQAKIPQITGNLIPEAITSIQDYYHSILEPMYQAISAYDPDKILQEEWLNSRGAIARFERNAIEIRVTDSQECTKADFAVIALTMGIIRYIIEETQEYTDSPIPSEMLKNCFVAALENGMDSEIPSKEWVSQFNLKKSHYNSIKPMLGDLIDKATPYIPKEYDAVYDIWMQTGDLSARLLKNYNNSQGDLNKIYLKLCECLIRDELYK